MLVYILLCILYIVILHCFSSVTYLLLNLKLPLQYHRATPWGNLNSEKLNLLDLKRQLKNMANYLPELTVEVHVVTKINVVTPLTVSVFFSDNRPLFIIDFVTAGKAHVYLLRT